MTDTKPAPANCADCKHCITGDMIYRHACPITGRKWAFFTEPKDSMACEQYKEKE